MKFPPEWSEFLSLLLRHRVKFLLIGAHALAAHGKPRATLDLDVFVEASVGNAKHIGEALADFGYRETAKSWRQMATDDRMIRLGREPLRIDILNKISGVSFAVAWRNRTSARIDGKKIAVLGLRDLRRNKRASGRPKDLLDLALLDEGGPTRAASRSQRTRRRPAAKRRRKLGTSKRRS